MAVSVGGALRVFEQDTKTMHEDLRWTSWCKRGKEREEREEEERLGVWRREREVWE